jgi:hypothetical protein
MVSNLTAREADHRHFPWRGDQPAMALNRFLLTLIERKSGFDGRFCLAF